MAACYSLSGKPSPFDGTTHIPCNLTAINNGGHSTCCAKGDLCLTNGMCKSPGDLQSGNNWYLRVACTDKDWKDPACPRYCENIERNRNTGIVFNCLKKDSWCCAYVGGSINDWPARDPVNTTCCAITDLTFNAADPIVYATATAPIRLSMQPTSTSLSTISVLSVASDQSRGSRSAYISETLISSLPESTSSSPATNGSSSKPSRALPIGLGVGIFMGVLLLLVGIVVFCIRRRKTRNLAKGEKVHEIAHSNPKGESTIYRHEALGVQATELPAYEKPAELAHERPAELPANEKR